MHTSSDRRAELAERLEESPHPSSTSPTQHGTTITTGWPCSSAGMIGSGGALRWITIVISSSGASATQSR